MSVVVVFYSRYHEKSLGFTKKLQTVLDIRKLCVDEKNVRQTIMNESEHYNVRKVPSVLIFHPNGFLEKINGIEECEIWYQKISSDTTDKEEPPKKEIEIVQKISTKTPHPSKFTEKIPIEDVEFEPRKLDTQPLVEMNPEMLQEQKIEDDLKADQEIQMGNSIKKSNSGDNIMSMAQQMQKQREMEVKD